MPDEYFNLGEITELEAITGTDMRFQEIYLQYLENKKQQQINVMNPNLL